MKILLSEIKKIAFSFYFVISVSLMAILCFTTNGYTDTFNSKTYSVIELMTYFDREFITNESSMSSIVLLRKSVSGYAIMFMPMVASLPFVIQFCIEQNSGFYLFSLSRIGRIKYFISKFLSALLSAGLVVSLGIILYGTIISVYFPPISKFSSDADFISYVTPNGTIFELTKIITSAFLSGVNAAMISLLICSISKNTYTIICLPFLIIYAWNTTIVKLSGIVVEHDQTKYLDCINALSVYSIAKLTNATKWGLPENITVLSNILFGIVVFWSFVIRRSKKNVL